MYQTKEPASYARSNCGRKYDPIIESPDAFVERLYDENDNLTQITDRNGVVTQREYDDLNRLVQIIEDVGGSDPNTATDTFMEYNGAVQVKLKDHDNNATTYGYDAALRLTSIQYPDHTGGSPGNSTYGIVAYEYWPGGMLKKRTAQDGIETSYAYNDLHQLTGRSYSASAGPSESFAWDKSGRLTQAVKTGVAQVDLVFDKLSRLTSEKLKYLANNDQYETAYDYDVTSSGATRTITYPGGAGGTASGRVVVETYDKRLRQTEIEGDSGGSQVVGTTWDYDAADRRDGFERANAVLGVATFDLNNRVTGLEYTDTSGTPATLTHLFYGYDPHGNRLFSQDLVHTARSEIYQYDARHRLVNFRRGSMIWSGGTQGTGSPSIPTALAHAQVVGEQSAEACVEPLFPHANPNRTFRSRRR